MFIATELRKIQFVWGCNFFKFGIVLHFDFYIINLIKKQSFILYRLVFYEKYNKRWILKFNLVYSLFLLLFYFTIPINTRLNFQSKYKIIWLKINKICINS